MSLGVVKHDSPPLILDVLEARDFSGQGLVIGLEVAQLDNVNPSQSSPPIVSYSLRNSFPDSLWVLNPSPKAPSLNLVALVTQNLKKNPPLAFQMIPFPHPILWVIMH